MGCMLSTCRLKLKLDKTRDNDRYNINHPARDSTHQRTPGQGRNMEAHRSVVGTSAHGPETVLAQPPLNSEMNNNRVQPKKSECNICGDPTKDVAIHPCRVCQNPYCISCLKSMFLKACKDESLMPARCCQIIHLSIVLPYLSQQEADLYRAKFEERSSSHRVYCPVPTCSAFIPARLIPAAISLTLSQPRHDDSEEKGEALETERQTPSQTVVFATGIRMEIHTPPRTPLSSECTPISQSPPTMSCPQCAAQICVSYKQLKHPQRPCSADDLDPGLAALLRRWKVKRCPKCRTAVKRMYGCSHIRCRCGAQWCWDCLKPIDRCEDVGCAEGSERDADEAREDGDESGGSDAEGPGMEDLDAEAEEWAASGLDFGDEPSDAINDPWNCQRHYWHRVVPGPHAFLGGRAECHRCWKEVRAEELLGDGAKVEGGELGASQPVNVKADSTTGDSNALPISENAAYRCVYCGLINCPACKTVDASDDR